MMAYGGQVMETYAAPQVTYAPQTYAAAPTTTYAQATTMAAPMTYAAAAPMMEYAQPSYAPMTYAAAPMVETVAAPVQYMTQAPSYVAAPQMMAAPQYAMQQNMIQQPAVPMQPMKLTEGIPTPEQIAQQKNGYSAALDKQLKEAIDTVQKETAIEKQMIQFTSEKNIALYNMQVDEKLIEAQALTDEQATFALLELNKAKVERGLQLSNQANGLVMDYQMKAIQTELAQKQYAFQVQYMKAEGALEQQYMQQVAQANTGTTYAVPAQAVAAK